MDNLSFSVLKALIQPYSRSNHSWKRGKFAQKNILEALNKIATAVSYWGNYANRIMYWESQFLGPKPNTTQSTILIQSYEILIFSRVRISHL